ncbi:MAG: hypothetical protein GX041_07360 [Clostridiales bacterium]|jgi:N-acetylglutamate synthase-like GNAT family acetyltransferase|nr:hypothetical protein [Clostridiales bacterium]
MLVFRKIKSEDLDIIYRDKTLRPLLTAGIPDRYQRFAVVIERDKRITGGASGYRIDDRAYCNCIVIKDPEDEAVLFDGLIRSLIYVLDREEVKEIYTAGGIYQQRYERIGFKPVKPEARPYNLMIDIGDFFNGKSCH